MTRDRTTLRQSDVTWQLAKAVLRTAAVDTTISSPETCKWLATITGKDYTSGFMYEVNVTGTADGPTAVFTVTGTITVTNNDVDPSVAHALTSITFDALPEGAHCTVAYKGSDLVSLTGTCFLRWLLPDYTAICCSRYGRDCSAEAQHTAPPCLAPFLLRQGRRQ